MSETSTPRTRWPLIAIIVTVAAILVAVIVMTTTMPPRVVVMATGAEGGAYHEFGKQYREILAREGVELRLVTTGGALENLALLRDPRSGVSAAFMQGGITNEKAAPEIESLGTLFYEPLWLFVRSELKGAGLEGLRGRKVSVGPEGSGTRAVALEVLKGAGIDKQVGELLGLPTLAAAEKLLSGEIDAALLLVSFDSPVVKRLLADERVEVGSFPHADAYVALYPFLSKVVLPAGIGDLARNRPPSDVTLFAPKASLAVRKDLHSAIEYLLFNAAMQAHSGPGIFKRAGEFPAPEAIDLPMSPEVLQFYKSGRPFLQNYLPFWAASLVGKLLILLIPLLGVLLPLSRFLPALYGWAKRQRIQRLYGELRFLEAEIDAGGARRHSSEVAGRLERLEQQANRLRVPITLASMLYLLRNHIAQVRERLKAYEKAVG